MRVDLVIHVINACIVSVAVRPFYPGWVVATWLATLCLVILARALIRRHYRRSAPVPGALPQWGRIFAANAFVTSCLWGLTGSVLLMTPDPLYHMFIVLVLGGMMAGGIVSNAAYLPALLAFLGPITLPVVVILVSRGDVIQIEMGMMLAIFAALMIVAGRDINQSIVENVRLRFAQQTLSVKLQASERDMAEAQALAHVGSWEEDLQTHRVAWSAETFRILGAERGTTTPSYQAVLARIHPDDRSWVEKADARLIAMGSGRECDYRLVMDDGQITWVHTIVRMTRDAKKRAVRMHGIVQDITERKHAEASLQFANVLLKTEMEASPDAILVVNASREITLSNQRFADMWDVPMDTLAAGQDEDVLALVMGAIKDPQRFLAVVQHLYDHPDETGHDELETIDGRFIDRNTMSLRSPTGEHLGRVWAFRDITHTKMAAAHALRMARYDPLTGLANRAVFVEALHQAMARTRRGEMRFAVISLDLDRFKDVNDTLGHPVGDALLTEVAHRLRGVSREIDTVARFGGDEFVMLALNIDVPEDAARVAEKLIATAGEPFSIQGNDIHTGASVGIDLYRPEEASDAETLLSHADIALHRAKIGGRGTFRFFTAAMDVEIRARVRLAEDLLGALTSGQLFLLYQPQIALGSGRLTGLEALVRWRHPERGLLSPSLFVPIAEKAGLVGKLGRWTLQAACSQAKAWLDAGTPPPRISVNVSALQFKTPHALEHDVREVLDETGLPPGLLELELTESALMDGSIERHDILQRLRSLGLSLAIDDFGTGYSSLEYLRRFTVDRIKIARSFITHLDTPRDAAIVRATIALFQDLGIKVIAEGVETQAQHDMLERWGCGEVQGFYFAEPLSAEVVTLLLCDGNTLRPRPSSERVA